MLMKSQKGSLLVGALLLVIALGAALFVYMAELTQVKADYDTAQKQVKQLKQLSEISISQGLQIEQALFEFISIPTEIAFEINEHYPRPMGAVGFETDHVHIFYKTEYTFTYGYDLENWQWCAQTVADKPGVVRVRQPNVVWTNKNTSIAPTIWRTINGIFYETELSEVVQTQATTLLSKKISETSKKHLNDHTMKLSMARALKQFLIEVMNASHAASNPVSGIELVTNLNAECKAI
jgi:hypothetical protein